MGMIVGGLWMETLVKLRFYLSQLGFVFAFLWIMMFIVFFADSLCGPVVPYLVREFLIDEAAVVGMIGLLNSVFNLVRTVANIPGAILGDRMDRSKIVLASSFASFLFASFPCGSMLVDFGLFCPYRSVLRSFNAIVECYGCRHCSHKY